MRVRVAQLLAVGVAGVLLAGCGQDERSDQGRGSIAEAKRQSRPIGAAPRFHAPPPLRSVRDCRRSLGPRSGAHLELFAEDRVVLIPAGIGSLPPRREELGRIVDARCFGPLVTTDPSGLVLVRQGTRATVGDLFEQWGQPLTAHRFGDFKAPRGTRVRAYVNGHPWQGSAAAIRLRRHAVIVLEVGPYVPPHRLYRFPPGT